MGNCFDKLEPDSKYLATEKPLIGIADGQQTNGSGGGGPASLMTVKMAVPERRGSLPASLDRQESVPDKVETTIEESGGHGQRCLVALFDYEARTVGEMSLRKGEKLLLINGSDLEWWCVEDKERTGRKGYVPSSFLAPEFSYEAHDWFFRGITRKDAERCLLQPGNKRGCFLIRESETTQGALCLSVLDQPVPAAATQPGSPGSAPAVVPGFVVNHYKVKRASSGAGSSVETPVFISTRKVLPSLPALVQFYSGSSCAGSGNTGPGGSARGLCCPLLQPCPRPRPSPADLSFQTRGDRWEIDRASLKLAEKLGAGQFGEVWRGVWNSTTAVAVKTLKPGSMSREEFLKEARVMKALNHPHLVRLLAVCSDEPIYIVTEFMSQGSLLQLLRSEEARRTLLLKKLLDFISQIASGMAYLEKRKFVHRDLAARNILVGEGDVAKVADFGLARLVEAGSDAYEAGHGSRFPVKWTAPEAALLGRFSTKSDVWSFGVLVLEVVTRGQVPYPSMTNAEALERVDAGYRMPRPPGCPVCVYEAALRCWDARAENRPTFASLRDLFDDLFVSAESGYRAAECISH